MTTDTPYAGDGWTNTYDTAFRRADDFFQQMLADGFHDIALHPTAEERDGQWRFQIRHTVTHVQVNLWIDGIDDMTAYYNQHGRLLLTVWNGETDFRAPELEDFAAPGYVPVRTFQPVGGR